MQNENKNIGVYEYILEQIGSGRFAMGDAILINDIAQELHISISPVRETLKKMEGEGIVEHHKNRGTFVTKFTVEDVRELFDIRIILECYALEFSINNFDEAYINQLSEEYQDPSSSLKPHHTLHDSIVEKSNKARLKNLYKTLYAQIALVNILIKKARTEDDIEKSRIEHLAILDNIRARDIISAKENLRAHLESTKESYMKKFLSRY